MGIDLLLLLSTREGGREGNAREMIKKFRGGNRRLETFSDLWGIFSFFFLEFGEKEVSIDSTYRYRID